MANKSFNLINHLTKNYNKAPVLKPIDDYSTLKGNDKYSLIEHILYEHNNNTLHNYLGNFLIKIYKPTDPSQQSLWNTDTTHAFGISCCFRNTQQMRDVETESPHAIQQDSPIL